MDIDEIEQQIESAIQDFCISENIDDLRSMQQTTFNYLLRYLNKHVISKIDLKLKNNIKLDNNIMSSNYNMYDFDLVLQLCNIYIYNVCLRYNKTVSTIGFSIFSGIDRSNIYNWGNSDSSKLSYKGLDIFKQLDDFREYSLAEKLQDVNNAMKVLPILNHEKKWNIQEAQELALVKALPAQDLARLDLSKKPKKLEVVEVVEPSNNE